MAQRMALAMDVFPDRVGFPAAIGRGFGRQSGVDPEFMQHAVGLKPQEIGLRHPLGMQKGAFTKLDIGQIKRVQADRRCIARLWRGRLGRRAGLRYPYRQYADSDGRCGNRCQHVPPGMPAATCPVGQGSLPCLF